MAFRRLQGQAGVADVVDGETIHIGRRDLLEAEGAGWQHLARPWRDLLPRCGAGADEARQIRTDPGGASAGALQPLGPGAAIDLEGAAQVARPDQAVQLVELPALAAVHQVPGEPIGRGGGQRHAGQGVERREARAGEVETDVQPVEIRQVRGAAGHAETGGADATGIHRIGLGAIEIALDAPALPRMSRACPASARWR
jgi:hypothetical protein